MSRKNELKKEEVFICSPTDGRQQISDDDWKIIKDFLEARIYEN